MQKLYVGFRRSEIFTQLYYSAEEFFVQLKTIKLVYCFSVNSMWKRAIILMEFFLSYYGCHLLPHVIIKIPRLERWSRLKKFPCTQRDENAKILEYALRKASSNVRKKEISFHWRWHNWQSLRRRWWSQILKISTCSLVVAFPMLSSPFFIETL